MKLVVASDDDAKSGWRHERTHYSGDMRGGANTIARESLGEMKKSQLELQFHESWKLEPGAKVQSV